MFQVNYQWGGAAVLDGGKWMHFPGAIDFDRHKADGTEAETHTDVDQIRVETRVYLNNELVIADEGAHYLKCNECGVTSNDKTPLPQFESNITVTGASSEG